MTRQPPRSTRTYTRVPYPTLFRSATRPREAAEPGGQGVERVAQVQPDGQGRERVEHIVATGHLQGDLTENLSPTAYGEGGARAVRAQVARHEVGVLVLAVGEHPKPLVAGDRGKSAGRLVVGPGDQQTTGHDPIEEVDEGGLIGRLGPPLVEMVGIDVRDERGPWRMGREGAATLAHPRDEK